MGIRRKGKLFKTVTGVVSTALLASSLTFAGVSAQTNESNLGEQDFTIAFKSQAVPADFKSYLRSLGAKVETELNEIGVLGVEIQGNPTQFLKSIASHADVLTVTPSIELSLNLPETNLGEMSTTGQALPKLEAGESIWDTEWQWDIKRLTNNGASHDISSGSKDTVVAVIDTGFDFNHPDLKDNIVPGSKTFVPGTSNAWDAHSHGTHVAGTIGANGRLKGIAPEVGLRAYRVFGTGGAAQIWITNAIISAANDKVDVINMSLGGTRTHGQWIYTDPETGEQIKLGGDSADIVAYNRAIRYAINKGVTVVTSAGNDGQDLSNPAQLTDWYNAYLHKLGYTMYNVIGATVKVPTGIPGVISVSAMGGGFGTKDRLAFYSNYGNSSINLTAPGGDAGPDYPGKLVPDYYKHFILSTVPTYLSQSNTAVTMFGEGGYGWKIGTSMAAPQVAGVAAAYIDHVFKTTGKKPAPSQVQTHLQQTTEDIGKVGYDEQFGHGLVNAYNALTR